MDDLSHAHEHHPDDARFAAIQSQIAELVAQSQYQSKVVIARIERMEKTIMTTLTDIQTKLGTLSTMLDAKAKSDASDLTAIGSQIDDIVEKHTDAAVPAAVVLDPVTGLPVAE